MAFLGAKPPIRPPIFRAKLMQAIGRLYNSMGRRGPSLRPRVTLRLFRRLNLTSEKIECEFERLKFERLDGYLYSCPRRQRKEVGRRVRGHTAGQTRRSTLGSRESLHWQQH